MTLRGAFIVAAVLTISTSGEDPCNGDPSPPSVMPAYVTCPCWCWSHQVPRSEGGIFRIHACVPWHYGWNPAVYCEQVVCPQTAQIFDYLGEVSFPSCGFPSDRTHECNIIDGEDIGSTWTWTSSCGANCVAAKCSRNQDFWSNVEWCTYVDTCGGGHSAVVCRPPVTEEGE